ncbi:MAG TPA: toprim domain-containing protein [Nitrososphaeria archaeon]|nr:toprim domain-containing protein [Nitrososphaeria archaeon]
MRARSFRRRARLLDEFEEILEKLKADSRIGIPIIVEGERDAESLRRLGVSGEIITVRSIRGLRRRFEREDVREVILLLDLDKEGEHVLKLVKKSLEGVVKQVNVSYWQRLKVFKRLGFTQIENLHQIPEKIQPRHHP